jgi:hypothetical protein
MFMSRMVLEDGEWEEQPAFNQGFHVCGEGFEVVEWTARHILVEVRILGTAKSCEEIFGVRFREGGERYGLDAAGWQAVAED